MPANVRIKFDIDTGDFIRFLETFEGNLLDLAAAGKQFGQDMVEQFQGQKDEIGEVSDAIKDLQRVQETAGDTMVQSINKAVDAYSKWRAELVKQGGLSAMVGETLPQETMGMKSALTSFKSSMMAEVPFGGLIGLMLLGGKRPEEVRSASTQAMRIFQQTGDVGSAELTKISGTVKELGIRFGMGPAGMFGEFQQAGARFAAIGMEIGDVLYKHVGIPIEGVGDSVIETSIALDSMFKQAAGTAAGQMSTLVRDFNREAAQSAREIAVIGLAARDTGSSVQAFTTSVMQSAAALKTQRVDVMEVVDAQIRFQQVAKDIGFGKQASAAYAERAVSQITQGLAGMSVGMSAVIGERISGGKISGLDAYYAMKEGFGGKGQNDEEKGIFASSIAEIAKMARENGRTDKEQRYFIEKMLPGISYEGSRAIQQVGTEVAGGVDIKDSLKNHAKELSGAILNREAETDKFQKSLLEIQNGVAMIGSGLLKAVISGFQSMYYSIRWLGAILKGDEKEQLVAEIAMSKVAKASTDAFKSIIDGFKTIKKGMGTGAGALGQFSVIDEDEIAAGVGLKRYYEGGKRMTPMQMEAQRAAATQRIRTEAGAELESRLRDLNIEGGTQVLGSGARGRTIRSTSGIMGEIMGEFSKTGSSPEFTSFVEKLTKSGKINEAQKKQVLESAQRAQSKAQAITVEGEDGQAIPLSVLVSINTAPQPAKPAESGGAGQESAPNWVQAP